MLHRNEQLVAAIEALISAGVNSQSSIVGAVIRLGFDRRHAGAVLGKNEGRDPDRHRWRRRSDGEYHRHAAAAGPSAEA